MPRALPALALSALLLAVPASAARIESGSAGLVTGVLGGPIVGDNWPTEGLYVIGIFPPGGSLLIDGGTQEDEPSISMVGQAAASGQPPTTADITVTGSGSKLTLTGDLATRVNILSAGAVAAGIANLSVLDGGELDIDATNTDGSEDPSLQGVSIALCIAPGTECNVLISGAGSILQLRQGGGTPPTGILAGGLGVPPLDGIDDSSLVNLRIDDGGVLRFDVGTQIPATTAQNGGLFLGGPTSPGAEAVDRGIMNLDIVGAGSRLEMAGPSHQIALGLGGVANVNLDQGGELSSTLITLGVLAGSEAHVVVDGGSSLTANGDDGGGVIGGNISIGLEGTGTVEVRDGTVTAGSPSDFSHGIQLGFDNGGHGTLRLAGPDANVDAGEALSVGVVFNFATTQWDDTGGTGHVFLAEGANLTTPFVVTGTGSSVAGNGTVTGDIFNPRGTVSPGDSIGTLTVTNRLDSGGTLAIEVADAASADRIDTGSDLNLFAGDVQVSLLDGYLPVTGDTFTIGSSGGGAVTVDPSVTTTVLGAGAASAFELSVNGSDLELTATADAVGLGLCQEGQLKALSGLCKKVLGCASKYLKAPSKDADQAKRDACDAKSIEKFTKSYDKAAAKAVKKGESCALEDPAADVAAGVVADLDALVDAIATDFDPDTANKDDAKLRSGLAKQAGALCGRQLSTWAKNVKKPNEAKRLSARAKADSQFQSKVDKAITKAGGKGVVYTGPDSGALTDTTNDSATSAGLLTHGS